MMRFGWTLLPSLLLQNMMSFIVVWYNRSKYISSSLFFIAFTWLLSSIIVPGMLLLCVGCLFLWCFAMADLIGSDDLKWYFVPLLLWKMNGMLLLTDESLIHTTTSVRIELGGKLPLWRALFKSNAFNTSMSDIVLSPWNFFFM